MRQSAHFGLVRDDSQKRRSCLWLLDEDVIVKLRRIALACLVGLVAFSGCSNRKTDTSAERLKSMAGGELKDVVPVKGVVSVDGSPAAGVNLYLYREDNAAGSILECRTDQEGKYCWTTRLMCDGLEPGKYRVGFEYIPNPKKNGTGVDMFKGKYKNPMKDDFKLTVEAGAPQEGVDYDLTTK